MIGKLHLEDVKTYKDTTLEFSPGVNVITGDTGQGKTNILLALNWVKDNRPLGIGLIRRGQDVATATMEVIDGKDSCSIIRKRGRISTSENSYGIEKDGLPVCEPLTSFGQSPPKVISDILGLSDINIQKQRDFHFLVYSPPGQIATFIRSITKLDDIDRVTKLITSEIRVERGKIDHYQKELVVANKKLAVLNALDLELLESMIGKAKDRILRIDEVSTQIDRIESTVTALKLLEKNWIILPDNLDQIFDDVEKYSTSVIKDQKSIDNLGLLIDKIKEIKVKEIVLPDNLDQIFDDVEKYTEIDADVVESIAKIGTLVDKIKKLSVEKIVLPKDLTILSTVESMIEKYIGVNEKIDLLLGLHEELCVVTLKIESSDVRLKRLKSKEKKLKEQLTICSSCGANLTEKSKACLLGNCT